MDTSEKRGLTRVDYPMNRYVSHHAVEIIFYESPWPFQVLEVVLGPDERPTLADIAWNFENWSDE